MLENIPVQDIVFIVSCVFSLLYGYGTGVKQ